MEILSIIIPCYNEESRIGPVLEKVLATPVTGVEKDIIVVDDASSDNSMKIVREYSQKHPSIRLYVHPKNQGKGACIHTGLENVSGTSVIIQDAD